jgi:hypothetical protein
MNRLERLSLQLQGIKGQGTLEVTDNRTGT